jgi:L-2-hydroxyglutarate oxidase
MSTPRYDAVVVGAGIIGLATARELRRAGRTVAVLEAEDRVAAHQSGHNSNVIHSGLYYRPGSYKARLAVAGRDGGVLPGSRPAAPGGRQAGGRHRVGGAAPDG